MAERRADGARRLVRLDVQQQRRSRKSRPKTRRDPLPHRIGREIGDDHVRPHREGAGVSDEDRAGLAGPGPRAGGNREARIVERARSGDTRSWIGLLQ